MKLSFLVSTVNGSYSYLAKRQAAFLAKHSKVEYQIIEGAQSNNTKAIGDYFIVYSTFQVIPSIIRLHPELKKDRTTFHLDSALYSIPFFVIKRLMNEGWVITTSSYYNKFLFNKLGIKIRQVNHFIPDPNPKAEVLTFDQRTNDLLTVGINERDIDRKGHFWNFMTQVWGLKTIRVCKGFCFGQSLHDLSDEQLFELYKTTKYYLAASHAETPHLPLLEAYAFGTPAIYLNAHEFQWIGYGFPFKKAFTEIKGAKPFIFSETDPEGFLDAIGNAFNISKNDYYVLAKEVRNLFEKNYSLNNRINNFFKLLKHDTNYLDPDNTEDSVEQIV